CWRRRARSACAASRSAARWRSTAACHRVRSEDVGLPVPSPTQVSAFKKGMEMHAHFYAGQNKLDVVALRIGSIYGPLYYSMHNPVSRICHAAARNAEPDFADRPDGKIFEDDQ